MNADKVADEIWHLSSSQRLSIIRSMGERGRVKVSVLAKDFGATVPEVFRNMEKLSKSNICQKDSEGYYRLTSYGMLFYLQLPLVDFAVSHKKYIVEHGFGDIPNKFVERMGELSSGRRVSGWIKVLEYWKSIYEKANDYVYNILSEIPYSQEILETLSTKVQNEGVLVQSIISQQVILPEEREKMLEKYGLSRMIRKGLIKRRMKPFVSVMLIMNEKEGCIMLPLSVSNTSFIEDNTPTLNNENRYETVAQTYPDLSYAIYGTGHVFHEWCLDYFEYCWQQSKDYHEKQIYKKA